MLWSILSGSDDTVNLAKLNKQLNTSESPLNSDTFQTNPLLFFSLEWQSFRCSKVFPKRSWTRSWSGRKQQYNTTQLPSSVGLKAQCHFFPFPCVGTSAAAHLLIGKLGCATDPAENEPREEYGYLTLIFSFVHLRTPGLVKEGEREPCGSEYRLPFGQQSWLHQLKEITEAQSVREAFLHSAADFSPKHVRAKPDHQVTGILNFTTVPKRAVSLYIFLKHTSETPRKTLVIKDSYKT